MPDSAPAVVAFIALGANILAAGVHLLFNPANRIARWFVVWTLVWIVVLASQGLSFLPGASPVWDDILSRSAFLLPVVFLAFALVMARNWEAPAVFCLIGCWAGVMVLADATFPAADWLMGLWYGLWMCGIAVMWGCSKIHLFPGRDSSLARRLLIGTLFLFAPVTVVASVFGGAWYGHYVAPVSSVALQFLILIGVVHFRFYDLAVRAARRDDIAARAAESERLAVVGEVAASVAHEVRNPLTGVRSLAQRMAEDVIDDDKRRHYAEIILNEIGRVESIVTSLLNIAKGQRVRRAEPNTIDLAVLLGDLQLLLARRAEEAGVTIEVRTDSVAVVAAADVLSQALLNLVLNAVRHAPPGGRVHLGAHRTDRAVEIVVRDDGRGIAPADRERVFEPFHTGGGGTGLGLAVVRRLVREEGWHVSVHDGPGGGAEFRLRIDE